MQVAPGHHVVEVEHESYERFATDVDMEGGETTPITVNLRPR